MMKTVFRQAEIQRSLRPRLQLVCDPLVHTAAPGGGSGAVHRGTRVMSVVGQNLQIFMLYSNNISKGRVSTSPHVIQSKRHYQMHSRYPADKSNTPTLQTIPRGRCMQQHIKRTLKPYA
jgi:hypothetical protein